MNYTLLPVQFPSVTDANIWRSLFRPCASQRLFLPVSRLTRATRRHLVSAAAAAHRWFHKIDGGGAIGGVHRRQSWRVGGRDPQSLGWGSWGSQEGRSWSWTGLGKHYSLLCTESTLESVIICVWKIGNLFGWNQQFLRPDSWPPDFEPDWRRWRCCRPNVANLFHKFSAEHRPILLLFLQLYSCKLLFMKAIILRTYINQNQQRHAG